MMSSHSIVKKLKEDTCLNCPEIFSPDIFETPLVSISDDESFIAFATEFKCDSPVPAKKAKVCRNLFGQDHPSVSSIFEKSHSTHSYKPRNSTPMDPSKCSVFHSVSLDNMSSVTNHHDGQELDKIEVTFNEDKCKMENSSFHSKHISSYVADPTTSDNPDNLKYTGLPSNILPVSTKNHLDLPYFEQEDEKKMDANYFKCIPGEKLKCTKTNTEEFPKLGTLGKSLDNVTDNLNSFYTSVLESQFTDINDNLESIKEEFELVDLDSINSDNLIDLDFDNIYEELFNVLNDDFPCEEGNGASSTNSNNALNNYTDLLPEINANIKSHSILLDSPKGWTKNQQDSSVVINNNEFSEDASYKRLSNSPKLPDEVTDLLISTDSLLENDRFSRTAFAGSETETYTPYIGSQLAPTSGRDKLNYNSDSGSDGHRIFAENQPLFKELQLINKSVCVSEENSSTADKQCDQEGISDPIIEISENISCFVKSKDSLFSNLENNCLTPTTPDIKFPIFKEKTTHDESYLEVQSMSFETYKEKDVASTKNEITRIVHSFFDNADLFENNDSRNNSRKSSSTTTPQFENDLFRLKLYEIALTSSKNIKEMTMTRDNAKSIQETPDVLKHSTQDFHQLQNIVPNNFETEEFRDVSRNTGLFSSSSASGKNSVVDFPNVKIELLSDFCEVKCKSSSTTETNSTLNFQKDFPESDQSREETLIIEIEDLNDIETEELENCVSTNIKHLTEEVPSDTVCFSQNSLNNQNFFHTQVSIENSSEFSPKTKLKPPRKENSNLLSTGIHLSHLKDLYDIDKKLAQAVLVSIAELNRKAAGVTQSRILKYIKQNKIILLNPKLHHEISRFLASACEVGIIKKKAFKYMLSDQVRAIADNHKKEQKIKHPRKIRCQQIDTIEKLSAPIYSPKLLGCTRAHSKLGTPNPKLMPKVFKTLRSRVVYEQ